jgi:hypothetical protein
MAVIDIRTEPSGRTRVLFDCRATDPGIDDVARIISAMALSCGGAPAAAAEAPPPQVQAQARANRQAASARNTSRPVTLPSRRRIRAS